MLRRVEGVSVNVVVPDRRFFSISHWRTASVGNLMLTVGSKEFVTNGTFTSEQLEKMLSNSDLYPTCFVRADERSYWKYQGKWWVDNEGLGADDVLALITSRQKRSDQTLRRAHSLASMAIEPTQTPRGHLSAELKQYVWAKYGGACSSCGSNVELQFDHIIPVSLGGATSEENLQILCGPCNRSKGASIA
jgi:hypothetical protein